MELSVIIVNYNVRYFLEQCLNSVIKASSDIKCEIFVVDNNSADGSCSMISTLFPAVKLIRNNYNAGFAKACNQALKIASGEYVLLLNPDTVVEENAFIKCLNFMHSHDDAGAVGVQMIDGNGRYLRESKRAFPEPFTALFKMVGLSKLFPRSIFFSRYYMEHIDRNTTAEIEVLPGAFMFIRKKVINTTGFLDERFFMYGEDIDLSWRIIKAGYKIYYFPEVKIIHYKGESTKKSPVNSTLFFYRSMLAFVEKHSRKKDLLFFLFFIKPAIYIRGFISLLKRALIIIFPVIADILIIVSCIFATIYIWEIYKYGGAYYYPRYFIFSTISAFVLAGVFSVYIAGGYKRPAEPVSVIKGLLAGCTLLLVVYALLPQEMRFSRAVMLLGSASVILIVPLFRILMAIAGAGCYENPFRKVRKALIVSNKDSYLNICTLINKTESHSKVEGRVSLTAEDLDSEVLGNIEQLKEVIRINRINEVFFSLKDLSASQIIELMNESANTKLKIKLVSEGEKIIIGSKAVTM